MSTREDVNAIIAAEIITYLMGGCKPRKGFVTRLYNISSETQEALRGYNPRWALIQIGKVMAHVIKDGQVALEDRHYILTPKGEIMAKNVATGRAIRQQMKTMRREQTHLIIGGAHHGPIR